MRLRPLGNTLRHYILVNVFIRPPLDYWDVIYDRTYIVSFQQSIKSIQYNAAIAITGAMWETSLEKFFQELDWKPEKQGVGQENYVYFKMCYIINYPVIFLN